MPLPASVQWSENRLRNLVPGRGLAEAPAKRSPGRSKLVRDVAKAMLKVMGSGWEQLTVPADLSAAWAPTLAAAKNPDIRAPLSLEQEVLAYGVTCLFPRWNQFAKVPTQSPKLVRKWFYLGGAAFAVRTLSRAVNLSFGGGWQMTASKALDLKAESAIVDMPLDRVNLDHHKRDGPAYSVAFRTLRVLLASADDEAYAEAVAAGEEARKEASLPLRAWLTFAMPTQAAWAEQDARDMLKLEEVPMNYILLMDALADPALALTLHKARRRVDYRALDVLLSRHGEQVAPALLALAQQAKSEERSLMYWYALEALVQVPTSAAVAYLVQTYAAGDEQVRKCIAPLFQASPAAALPVLRAAAESAPALQETLDAMLRANPDLDSSAAPQASGDALPALLREPPSGKPLPVADWDLGRLPQLRLVGTEQVLPPEAMVALGQALRASAGQPNEPLQQALQAIEPADRIALADMLWEMWSEGLSHWQVWLSARKWLGQAQGLLGNDEVARRIGREVCGWSGRRYNQGKACLSALQIIGTDAALQQIHDLSKNAASKGIRKAAAAALQAEADARGQSLKSLLGG